MSKPGEREMNKFLNLSGISEDALKTILKTIRSLENRMSNVENENKALKIHINELEHTTRQQNGGKWLKLNDYVYDSGKKKAVLILEDIDSEEFQELVSSLSVVESPLENTVDHTKDVFGD